MPLPPPHPGTLTDEIVHVLAATAVIPDKLTAVTKIVANLIARYFIVIPLFEKIIFLHHCSFVIDYILQYTPIFGELKSITR